MDNSSQSDATPPLSVQADFWDGWNGQERSSAELDAFQTAQRNVAIAAANRLAASSNREHPLRLLDLGCGTGWLGNSLTSFGDVTGVDLSPRAIDLGRRLFPDVHLLAGHFSDVSLDDPFDMVVSADTIGHVADQQAFVDRVAALLRPGGTFLLMTQNDFVWRRSNLAPQGHGQIRDWPSLSHIRTLLDNGGFRITRISSIHPGGSHAAMRLVNNSVTRRGSSALRLARPAKKALERLRLGRELTIEAKRL